MFILKALFGWEWSALTHSPTDVYLASIMFQALVLPLPTGGWRECGRSKKGGSAEPWTRNWET